MAKSKSKRATKCTPEVIEKICILLEGKTPWKKIAKVLSIGERTLEYWRDKKSEFYQPDLVAAVAATLEKVSCGEIKANQHIEANKHKLKKVVKELRIVDVRSLKKKMRPPPPMPPSSFSKDSIIQYADEVLDLILDPKYTIDEMRVECAKRIRELGVEVFVKVKEEEQEVAANQQAVKNVLTNCGPQDQRWNFDTSLKHSADETLAEFLKGLEE